MLPLDWHAFRPVRGRIRDHTLKRNRSKKPRHSSSGGPARQPSRRSPQFGHREARRAATGPARTLTGVVSANRAGFGFVRSDELVETVAAVSKPRMARQIPVA